MSYDRAITVFSPNGHLFQVEYALEAVGKGLVSVGIRGKDCIIFGVEKKSIAKLQDPRTVRKIQQIDQHIHITFAGLTADARVLINKARLEAQNYRMSMEDAPTIEYVTKAVANYQQKYTQQGGSRPFGISTLIGGFDPDKTPRLYQTDPAGTWTEWKAHAVGRNSKTVDEFLVGEFVDDMDVEQAVQLAVQALLEIVESKSNIDVAVIRDGEQMTFLDEDRKAAIVEEIERKKAAKAETKQPILQ
ncbi:Proteasome subunit alpha type [Entamoeba marina]